jgi:hypothetical protein
MDIWNHNGELNDKNPIGLPLIKSGLTPRDIGAKPIAYIIDDQVVETSVVNKKYYKILTSNFTVEDVTHQYKGFNSESGYVIRFSVDNEPVLTVGVLKRYGAIMLSNPAIVEITEEYRGVQIGWEYKDGVFTCPPDFDLYSEDLV